jgi:hypothetical protein
LGLTSDEVKRFEEKIRGSPKDESLSRSPERRPEPSARHRRVSKSPIPISSDENEEKMSEREHARRARAKKEYSRDTRNRYDNRNRDRSPPRMRSRSPRMRSRSPRMRSRSPHSRSRSHFSESRQSDDEKDGEIVNIVTVGRLLASLEIEVGAILSARVFGLLEKALTMERQSSNSSENLLRDNANLIFLDTVKEKLKGAINAGLVASSRVHVVKKAVKSIASLMHEASKLNPIEETVEETPLDAAEAAKLEIAKALSKTLIEQGRTDVTAEELSEIVEEFLKSQLQSEEKEKEPPKEETSESDLENLTDDDLKTLLRNFSDLTEDEQKHLIKYLERLEKTDSKRMKLLSKYVDAGEVEVNEEEEPVKVQEQPKVENMLQNISDDEYEGDEEVLKAPQNSAFASSSLLNSFNIANDLENSLMQSQQRQQQHQQMPTPSSSTWGQGWGSQNYYQNQMQFNYAQPSGSNAWNMGNNHGNSDNHRFNPEMGFANRQPGPPGVPPVVNPNRRQPDRSNNLQLTGKGINRSK